MVPFSVYVLGSETLRELHVFYLCFNFCVFLKSKKFFEQVLGAFAKLRKATISFVMSVRPSARIEQLGSHWTDFREILYLKIF